MCLNETWSSSSKKRRESIFHTWSWISWTPDRRVLWIKPLAVFSLTLCHATCNNADYTNNTLWITHIICLVHDYIYHICCFCDRSIFTLSCETHWFIYFKQKNSQKRPKRVIHSIQRWQFYVDLLWQIVQFLEGKPALLFVSSGCLKEQTWKVVKYTPDEEQSEPAALIKL